MSTQMTELEEVQTQQSTDEVLEAALHLAPCGVVLTRPNPLC